MHLRCSSSYSEEAPCKDVIVRKLWEMLPIKAHKAVQRLSLISHNSMLFVIRRLKYSNPFNTTDLYLLG